MKKLLLLVAWVFCINCGIVMASSPDIAVAVVHGQFAAELSCEDELMVRVPDTGEEMVLKPDRYFVNAGCAEVWRQNVTFCGKRKWQAH